jgi:hypothetical protein
MIILTDICITENIGKENYLLTELKEDYLRCLRLQASVHLNLRGSRLRSMALFLHLLLQKRNTLPSRRTKFIPVPGAIASPQKLHLWTCGIMSPIGSSLPHAQSRVEEGYHLF